MCFNIVDASTVKPIIPKLFTSNDKTHLLFGLCLALALLRQHHGLHTIYHNGHRRRPLVLLSIPVLNLDEARFVWTVSKV